MHSSQRTEANIIHTVTICTLFFLAHEFAIPFLAMSDFSRLFRWSPGGQEESHIHLWGTQREKRISRTSRWSCFHNITTCWLRKKNQEVNQEVWCSRSWQPAAHVFKMFQKFLGSSAAFEPWFCPRSKGQSQRLCSWCENVQFLRWGLQSRSKNGGKRISNPSTW